MKMWSKTENNTETKLKTTAKHAVFSGLHFIHCYEIYRSAVDDKRANFDAEIQADR